MDDYELVPLEEVKKLKEEVARLRKEQVSGPQAMIADALDKMANSLDRLFKIFDVAAADIERDNMHEQSFEEKIHPLLDKLRDVERQNKDIADAMLALADLVKKRHVLHANHAPAPAQQRRPNPSMSAPSFPPPSPFPQDDLEFPGPRPTPRNQTTLPPLPGEEDSDLPPPPRNLPPPPQHKGFLDKFK